MYGFLVQSTKIESALFSYKTALSEANFKRNRMMSTKWNYHKERSFAMNYFIFLNIFFEKLTTQMPIFVLFVNARADGAFSLCILKCAEN